MYIYTYRNKYKYICIIFTSIKVEAATQALKTAVREDFPPKEKLIHDIINKMIVISFKKDRVGGEKYIKAVDRKFKVIYIYIYIYMYIYIDICMYVFI
jgi:hypothetical protein